MAFNLKARASVLRVGTNLGPGRLIDDEPSGFELDFLRNRSVIKSTSALASYEGRPFKVDGGQVEFSRSSNATVTDADGKIKWAPHNLLSDSESFDESASWTISGLLAFGSGSSVNAIAAPNGTTSAEYLRETNTYARHYVFTSPPTIAGANYTVRLFAKAGERTFIAICIRSTDGVTGYSAVFNLSTGAVTATYSTGTPTNVSAPTPTNFGGGWYMLSVSMNATTPATYIEIGLSDSGTPTSPFTIPLYTGTGTSGLYVWGAHLYRSDLGGMQPNTSEYPMYNPTTPKNLLGYTEDFSASPIPWINNRGAIIANSTTGPVNGFQTADALNQIAASTVWAALQQSHSVAAGRKVFSVYAKPNGKNYLIMQANLIGAGNVMTWFNVATGAAGTTNASHTALTPVSLGNGWWRFAIALDTTAATWSFGVGLADADSSTTVTDVGGLYLWGAQLSDSASLDPYDPVYGAAVTSAAYYGPRRDFNGSTLACKGLLVEEQRANLSLYSRTLETTGRYWGSLSSGTANTITIDNAPGPDGLSTSASLLTFNTAVTGTGIFSVWRQLVSTTANGAYTCSVWLKANTTSTVYLLFNDNAGNRANATCTLTSSWQRFTVTGTTVASISAISFDIGANGFFGQTMTAGTVYVYGAQIEAGSFATSYIPTGAATATRLADVASVSTQAFPYSAAESTVVANGALLSVNTPGYKTFCTLSDGTSNNRIAMYCEASVALAQQLVSTGGALQSHISPGSVSANTNFKMGTAVAVNDAVAYLNGTAGTPDTGVSVPSAINVLYLGSNFAGNETINGHIKQITYIPRRIANEDLQERTAV
jgi:hypothetical protein